MFEKMEAFFSFVLQLFIWILVSTSQHMPTARQKNEKQPGPIVKTWSILKINGIWQPTTILKSLSGTFISSHKVAGKLVCTPGIGTKKL